MNYNGKRKHKLVRSRSEPLHPPLPLVGVQKQKRTNFINQIEAWHGRWNPLVGSNAGMIGIIKELRLKDKFIASQIGAQMAGTTVKKRHIDEQIIDANLLKIFENFENYDPVDFILAIAENLGS